MIGAVISVPVFATLGSMLVLFFGYVRKSLLNVRFFHLAPDKRLDLN
ncbi:hypothetical protein PhaeoP78_02699 [Phaeobacter inhibens]|nr:hypothetical protein PhaeoP78_02699 [Phaeobacter inhibens]